jgi:putative copper resistance protein D
VDELIILSRFVHYAALAVLFGGSLFRLCVAKEQHHGLHQWPQVIDIAAAVAALLSALGWLVGVAATMVGDWAELVAPDTMAAVLIDTRFGRIWIGRLSLAVAILGLAFVVRRRTRKWDVVMLFLSAALTASLAGVGHGSVGAGWLGPVHLVGDVVHLLCAAAWLGGLVGLALVLLRASRGQNEHLLDVIRTAVPRFSRLGYVAVGLLLATGFLNTIVLVPRPESLVTTAYGRTLLIKIGLVALMIGIAVRNRFILAPRLFTNEPSEHADEASVALFRSVAVEQVLGLLVLATVAFLGMMHPMP